MFTAILLTVALLAASVQPDSPTSSATVTRVIDGDTLDAQVDGVRMAVGYLGAAAPDLNARCGPEAFARNMELAHDGVLLESDAAAPPPPADAKRRALYYAYTLDGTSIDQTLVAEGLAHASHLDGSQGQTLAALEATAQANGTGCLWAG